jgi:hypothetical protein
VILRPAINTPQLRVLEQAPTLRWGALIGDGVHNLRSALDHAVEALTIRNTGGPLKNTSFPIFSHEFGDGNHVGFRDMKKDGVTPTPTSGLHKIRGVTYEAQAYIEVLQPYHAGGDVETHPLMMVHNLDILDKHRVIPVVAMSGYLSSGGVGRLGGPPIDIVHMDMDVLRRPFPFEDGTEIPGVVFSPSTQSVDVNFKLSLEVTFDEAGPGKGLNLVCLRDMFLRVADIIHRIDRFIATEHP